MDKIIARLSVFFEDPFWVGIFEQESSGRLSASKVTFGAEPKDYEVKAFLLQNYDRLKFSPTVTVAREVKEHVSPKRLQRDAKRQVEEIGIGTKSQQALKLQQEQGKLERKVRTREQREAEKQLQFELKQQKRKEKHKGR